jgi:hypothetical protein
VLLLVTLALVLASAVLLVLGFVQDALGFIYLSMLCAGVAALALIVFARLAKRRGAALAGAGIAGGGAYIPGGGSEPSRPAAARTGMAPAGEDDTAVVAVVPSSGTAVDELGYEDEPFAGPAQSDEEWAAAGAGAASPVGVGAGGGWDDEGGEDWGDEVYFPIEDYDDLRVAEILPLLSQLEPDELQEVRDREVAGKARATILDRIDDRLGRTSSAVAPTQQVPIVPAAVPEARPEPGLAGPGPGATTRRRAPAAKKADEPAPRTPAARKSAAAKAAAGAADVARPGRTAKTAAAAKSAAGTATGAATPPAKAGRAAKTAAAAKSAATGGGRAAAKSAAAKAPAEGAAPVAKATPAKATGTTRKAATRKAAEAPVAAPMAPPAVPLAPAADGGAPAPQITPGTGARKATAKKAAPAKRAAKKTDE